MTRRYLLKKIQFFVMRHAVPVSMRDLYAFRHGPKVFANSVPKAGTNLLKRLLTLLPYIAPRWTYHLDRSINGYFDQLFTVKKGQVLTAHIPKSQKIVDTLRSEDFKMLFIIRDVRDLAYSNAYYYTHKDTSHPLHGYFKSLQSDDERLTASICGVPASCSADGQAWGTIGERVDNYLGWLEEPDCLIIRFEDLIGEAGGGSEDQQLNVVRNILQHLNIPLTEKLIQHIGKQTFYTGARTFRKGQIGDWRNHFTEEHKRIFKEVAGDVLIKMGYENNYDW